ncbi:MAG: GNAT family N-acetyltransferase [Acidimicrobiia bacterium]
MSVTTSLKRVDEFGDEDTRQLGNLKGAVYPASESASWPGRVREWAAPEWGVFVANDTGDLVSYTGVVAREGLVDGTPVRTGGVGGVATHPDHRRRGYAAVGIAHALEFLRDRGADFAILVCDDNLVDYYTRLGWRRFAGPVINRQHAKEEIFSFNEVMVTDLCSAAPLSGTIDVQGPLW